MKVQVITDSTSDIPPELAEELDIRVVPIYLRFGDKIYRDGVDIRSDEFYSMLTSSPIHPATSQPNPEDFASVYKEYCEKTDGIVSIHISSRISGTFNSATIAQKTLKSRCPIEVIDSKFNSAGLGLVVMAAARLAQSGASLSDVVNEANQAVSQVCMFGMFETMKYLARSGRVNKTIATASQILHVMPLLTFFDGEIPLADCAELMSVADIFTSVVRKQDIGSSAVLQAAAAGGAPILSEHSEYREMVNLGFRAQFVDINDEDTIIAAMRTYVEDESLRRSTADCNQQYISQYEDYERQMTKLLELIDQASRRTL